MSSASLLNVSDLWLLAIPFGILLFGYVCMLIALVNAIHAKRQWRAAYHEAIRQRNARIP